MAEELARLLDEHDYENAGTTMIEGRAAFIQREIINLTEEEVQLEGLISLLLPPPPPPSPLLSDLSKSISRARSVVPCE